MNKKWEMPSAGSVLNATLKIFTNLKSSLHDLADDNSQSIHVSEQVIEHERDDIVVMFDTVHFRSFPYPISLSLLPPINKVLPNYLTLWNETATGQRDHVIQTDTWPSHCMTTVGIKDMNIVFFCGIKRLYLALISDRSLSTKSTCLMTDFSFFLAQSFFIYYFFMWKKWHTEI